MAQKGGADAPPPHPLATAYGPEYFWSIYTYLTPYNKFYIYDPLTCLYISLDDNEKSILRYLCLSLAATFVEFAASDFGVDSEEFFGCVVGVCTTLLTLFSTGLSLVRPMLADADVE